MNKSIIFMFYSIFSSLMLSILIFLILMKKLTAMELFTWLILYSIISALNTTKIFNSTFFSYLTFFMMTGGLLVLFSLILTFMAEETKISKKNLFLKFLIIMLMTSFIFYTFTNKEFLMNLNYLFNKNNLIQQDINLFMPNFNIVNYKNIKFNIFLILLVLLLMIFVTKIIFKIKKPMKKLI
uniref:NADH dehydrogenase subunit 6 n=1 Tax=Allorhynchium sp. YN TaxID=2742724 RepID=A0A6M9AUK6_9HYME|nr:NADH dehydrogenase subunit 6 [Allorhynchium sp. YN]QKK69217.1 NADH dehydrogenase subunit 6 [Allorhynchium sp. YN]